MGWANFREFYSGGCRDRPSTGIVLKWPPACESLSGMLRRDFLRGGWGKTNYKLELRGPVFADFGILSPPSKNQTALTPSISRVRSSSLNSRQLVTIPSNNTVYPATVVYVRPHLAQWQRSPEFCGAQPVQSRQSARSRHALCTHALSRRFETICVLRHCPFVFVFSPE